MTLCGSWFGLGTHRYKLLRHRAFETNWGLSVPSICDHDERPTLSVAGHAGRAGRNCSGTSAERREAMQIPWLDGDRLSESIPPLYTARIGADLLAYLALNDETRAMLGGEPNAA